MLRLRPGAGVSSDEDAEVLLSLEPTSPRPPEPVVQASVAKPASPAAVQRTAAEEPPAQPAAASSRAEAVPAGMAAQAPTGLTRLDTLSQGSYYVQIGLFGSEASLSAAISLFADKFPLVYQKVDSEVPRYRLFVGPLGRDEGGLTLVRIRAMGYRDAVLKGR